MSRTVRVADGTEYICIQDSWSLGKTIPKSWDLLISHLVPCRIIIGTLVNICDLLELQAVLWGELVNLCKGSGGVS
jgi:hypothetical protein